MPVTVEGLDIKPIEYTIRGSSWGLRTDRSGYGNPHRVIMGNVPYPIDFHQIKMGEIKGVDNYFVREFLHANGIDVFVNIGDVDIVPSRDDMKYTDRTSAAITSAYTKVFAEIGAIVGKQLDACDTEWDAMVAVRSLNTIRHLQAVMPKVMWRGAEISSNFVERQLEQLTALDAQAVATYYAITSTHRATIDATVADAKNPLRVSVDPDAFFVIDNLPKGGAMLTRALVHQKLVNVDHNGRAQRYGHTVGSALMVATTLTKKQISDFFGGMPEDRIVTTQELKGVVPIPASLKPIKDTIYRWSGTSWAARVNIPTGDTYYYLPLTKDSYTKRYSFTNNRYGSQKDALNEVRKAAVSLGLDVSVIYGIKADDVTNFDAKWVNLVDAIEAEIEKQIKANAEVFAWQLQTFDRDYAAMETVLTTCKVNKLDPMFVKFIGDLNKMTAAHRNPLVTTVNQMTSRIPKLKDVVKTAALSVKVPDVSVSFKAINTKYPMVDMVVQLVGSSYSGSEILRNNASKVLAYVTARR